MHALGHFLALAGMMTVFGTRAFQAVVSPRPMRPVLLVALAACIIGGALWLTGQAARFGADVPTVLSVTWFGRVLVTQLGLVVVAVLAPGRTGVVPAALAVMAGAALGHGAAMGGAPDLTASGAIHLLGAGAWLGSLPALLLAVRAGEAGAARRYGRIGIPAVFAIAISAAWQGWFLGGGLPGLLGTEYGDLLMDKAALFAAMLGLAWLHRARLVPALPAARRWLLASALVETLLGGLALAAAVALSARVPGMHEEQPAWPFAWRPDLFAFGDTGLRQEVMTGLALCGVAAILAVAGVWRRLLWLGVPVALWLGLPHLDLLVVPAYPTSYWLEPAPPSRETIQRGEVLYDAHCAACHGAGKRGDGPRAAGLVVPPADLTAEHLWDHADGELFWWLTAGMAAPDGTPVMPGFAQLSEEDRWALIDAIRAANPQRRTAPRLVGHRHGAG